MNVPPVERGQKSIAPDEPIGLVFLTGGDWKISRNRFRIKEGGGRVLELSDEIAS